MAKKTKKKTKKAKLSKDKKEKLKTEGELPKKEVLESESRQLMWFLIIVGLVFVAFLIPYFYFESQKTFHYGGVDWDIDDSDNIITFYHSQFRALNGANINYNIYLRGDPRENDVYTEGKFNSFKYGGYLSWTEDIQKCRGQVPRAALDMKSFVRTGVGIGNIDSGSSTPELAEELGFPYVDCFTNLNRTVIVLRMGEPSVLQSENNPYCYYITIKDCDDFAPIEKFIIKTIDDSTPD
jgi:hypothetical protein